MLKNYFKIAIRNLSKQKLYSFINISGLTVGLTFCLLVLMFVNDELNFDQFHENKADIYRLYRSPLVPDTPYDRDIFTPLPTGQSMLDDLPEVESYARFTPFGSMVIRTGNELIDQDGFAFADPNALTMFSFPTEFGDAEFALRDPNSIVITKEIAKKYFGDSNPVGQFMDIRINEEFQEFRVDAVLKDVPSNSSIQFSLILPIQTVIDNYEVYKRVEDSWRGTRTITYVQLRKETDLVSLRSKLPDFINTYMGDAFDEMRADGRLSVAGPAIIYDLQPLLDIHLDPDFPGGFTTPSNPIYSYVLGGIALTVLLIACFNFMILAIGRSAKRVKEVGLRKVVGAQRNQLMIQFWGEAILLTAIAFITGLVLTEFVLPVFNELANKQLTIGDAFGDIRIIGGVVLIFLFTGVVAGSYPALVLSGFMPIDSLKEKMSFKGSNTFTKSLIVVQFGLTIFLVTATLIISDQLRFLQEKNLGFSGEQVVVIPSSGTDGVRALEIYRNELSNDTHILEFTGANVSFASGLWRRGYQYNGEVMQTAVFRVDPNYINTLQMNLIAGRNFDTRLSSDSTSAIIVNQTFLDRHGLNLGSVGESFPIDWGWMVEPTIIGVVEDFNYQSLQNTVEPIVIYMNPRDPILNIMVRISPDDMQGSIAKLRSTWGQITAEIPFSYSFLDSDMDNLYRNEAQWSRIISYSSFLAIFIACLGLFGLAGIVAIQRQKEIGIRKVLGATTSGITFMLSSGFARLVSISILIACPVAWYVMENWLSNFAYRIDISIWMFILSGFIAIGIAMLTVSYQSVKAAIQDPVKNLRSE